MQSPASRRHLVAEVLQRRLLGWRWILKGSVAQFECLRCPSPSCRLHLVNPLPLALCKCGLYSILDFANAHGWLTQAYLDQLDRALSEPLPTTIALLDPQAKRKAALPGGSQERISN